MSSVLLGASRGDREDLAQPAESLLLIDDASSLSRHSGDREQCISDGLWAVASSLGEALDGHGCGHFCGPFVG